MWSPRRDIEFKKRNQYASLPASGGQVRTSKEHGERVITGSKREKPKVANVLTTKRMKRGLLYLMVLRRFYWIQLPGDLWIPGQHQFQWSDGPEAAVQWVEK